MELYIEGVRVGRREPDHSLGSGDFSARAKGWRNVRPDDALCRADHAGFVPQQGDHVTRSSPGLTSRKTDVTSPAIQRA